MLDFGNAAVRQKAEVFEKLAPYAYHVHAKLEDFKPDGEATDSDYGTLLGILRKDKYQGAVSIEWEGKGDAVAGVKKSRDLALRVHRALLRPSRKREKPRQQEIRAVLSELVDQRMSRIKLEARLSVERCSCTMPRPRNSGKTS